MRTFETIWKTKSGWLQVDLQEEENNYGKWILGFKLRLVANNFTKLELNDCNKKWMLWPCYYMRVIIAIMNHYNLEDIIYVEHLEIFVEDKSMMCPLKKSLYKLKQGTRKWYLLFDEFILKNNFMRVMYTYLLGMMKSFSTYFYMLRIYGWKAIT